MNSKATPARLTAFSTLSALPPKAAALSPARTVAAGAAERVPVGHGKPQMVLHRFAFDHFVFVVVVESQQFLLLGPSNLTSEFLEMRPWEVLALRPLGI